MHFFGTSDGLSFLSKILIGRKEYDDVVFNVIGLPVEYDEELSLKYTMFELKTAFEKTKYKVGINKQNAPSLKSYLNTRFTEKVAYKKGKVVDNLPWVSEVKSSVDKDLISSVVDQIPNNFPSGAKLDYIDKVIYAYFLLCNKLVYDIPFFLNNDLCAPYHENFVNMANISLENNKVICYEFNMILAVIAEKFGFKSSICDLIRNPNGEAIIPIENVESFKNEHYSLLLDDGVHSIYFDSTRGSLDIDLFNVKKGMNVRGIKANNPKDYNYLNYKLDNVYKLYLKNFDIKLDDSYISPIDIEKNVLMLENLAENLKNGITDTVVVPFEDKLDAYLSLSKSINLDGLDAFSFLYKNYKNIFENEKEQYIFFRIIRTNEEDINAQTIKLVLIYSENGLKTPVDDRDYYIFEANKGFNKVNSNEILEPLYNKEYVNVFSKYIIISGNEGRRIC